MKPQTVRLLDVALIGPVMVIAATALPSSRGALSVALAIFGFGTIAYNAHNYLKIQARGNE